MKFLTDENVALSVLRALRNADFDVKDVKEEKRYGITDKELLAVAHQENRIIITHDKDFVDLLLSKPEKKPGIILLRFKNQNPNLISKVLVKVLRSEVKDKFKENLTVISETQITIHK